jgi:2-polyprenyl-3-methyl-5-hydroxy-6-metoxy-1,4-benzoquinol methylase
MNALTSALLKEIGRADPGELTERERFYFDYANSSNDRGEELVGKLEREFLGSLAGRRVLDIGSGYGGCCIAAAKRGASVVGLELSHRTLEMARANAQDHGANVEFLSLDMTDGDPVAKLGRFDLVIADNVIEHVRNPAGLVANSSRLLLNGGYMYVTAPNARSVDMVRSEVHYGMSGASLVSPKAAEAMLNEYSARRPRSYEVTHYLAFRQYVELFERYFLEARSLLVETSTSADVETLYADARAVAEAVRTAHGISPIFWLISEALERWLAEFSTDVEFMRAADEEAAARFAGRIHRDYGYPLWYFMARKS